MPSVRTVVSEAVLRRRPIDTTSLGVRLRLNSLPPGVGSMHGRRLEWKSKRTSRPLPFPKDAQKPASLLQKPERYSIIENLLCVGELRSFEGVLERSSRPASISRYSDDRRTSLMLVCASLTYHRPVTSDETAPA